MGNNSLFDGDDSDIIVDSSYFGAADTTGDGKIVINSSYFGADGAIDPEDDVHLESAEFNEETRELVLTLNDGENITTVIEGAAGIEVAATPTEDDAGDQWLDTNSGRTYFLTDSGSWVQTAGLGQFGTAPSGATSLGALTDVTLGQLSDNQVLTYDTDAGMWVNTAAQDTNTTYSFTNGTTEGSFIVTASGGSNPQTVTVMADVTPSWVPDTDPNYLDTAEGNLLYAPLGTTGVSIETLPATGPFTIEQNHIYERGGNLWLRVSADATVADGVAIPDPTQGDDWHELPGSLPSNAAAYPAGLQNTNTNFTDLNGRATLAQLPDSTSQAAGRVLEADGSGGVRWGDDDAGGFPTYGPVQFARNDNTTGGFDGSITLPSGMTSARIKMSVRPYNEHVANFWMDVSNITNVTLEAGDDNFIRLFGTKSGSDTRITVYSTNSILSDGNAFPTLFPPTTAQFGLLDGETPSMSNLQYSFPPGGAQAIWSISESNSRYYLEIEATQTGTITFGGITNDISRYFVQYHYIT